MTALYVHGLPKRNIRVCSGNKTDVNFKSTLQVKVISA